MNPVSLDPVFLKTPQVQESSAFTLMSLIEEFHQNIQTLTAHQVQGLRLNSLELEKASNDFLKKIEEAAANQKNSNMTSSFGHFIQYLGAFISTAVGVGLCATGGFCAVGAMLITTGITGFIHTSLEISDAYTKLSKLVQDKGQQEIIKTYIPMLISISLILANTATTGYSVQSSNAAIKLTLDKFMPFIMKALTIKQQTLSSIFQFQAQKLEAQKIDNDGIVHLLQEIMEEQHAKLSHFFDSQKMMNQQAQSSLNTISSYFQAF